MNCHRIRTTSRLYGRLLDLFVVVSLLLGVVGPVQVLHAAGSVELDGAVSSNTADGVNTIDVPHNTGTGTNRLMLVGVSANSYGAARTISSVTFTYDTTELPLDTVGSIENGSGRLAAIYYLLDPPSGQSGTVTVDFSDSVAYGIVAGVANFSGVDQTTPLGTFASNTGQSTAQSVDLTGLDGDELVFDTLFIGAATIPALTVGADQTEQWNTSVDRTGGAASAEQATTDSVTMSWTTGSSVYWAIGAVPINPVAGPTHDLTVAVDPSGGGTTDPAEGVHSYAEGSVVDISATPNVGYVFDHWEGDCTGSGTCQVTMDQDRSVTAYFAAQNYDLTMAVDPSGGGTTTPAVGGPYSYGAGAVVDISATANEGYLFDYWDGDVTDPDSASTTVTMDGDKTVTAHFVEGTLVILDGAVSSNTADDVGSIDIAHTTGTGSNRLMLVGVSWNCGTTDQSISSVTFTPDGGAAIDLDEVRTQQAGTQLRYAAIYSLLNPPSGVSGTVTVTFSGSVSNGIVAGVANFAGVDQTTPLGTANGEGSGTNDTAPSVTLTGLNGDELVFDNVFQGASGESQTLTAGSGQTELWNSWIANTRAAASTEQATSSSVTMSWTAASASYWAIAAVPINPAPVAATYDLTIAVDPVGGGTTAPEVGVHTYDVDTVVEITATASVGYEFDYWSGECVGTGDCQVIMDADKEVTAHFELLPASGSATSSVVPSDATPTVGDQIEVDISIDVSGVDEPNNALGSFTGSLDWDPAVLTHNSNSGLLNGFTGAVNPSSGSIAFNGMNTGGALGTTTVLNITFDVVGAGTSNLDLEYSAMAAAYTYVDLIPILTVYDGQVEASTAEYTLTVAVSPPESGTTDPAVGDHDYPAGAVVTIMATPATGYLFSQWSGACTGSGTCQVTMDADKEVTAEFEALPGTIIVEKQTDPDGWTGEDFEFTGAASGSIADGGTIEVSGLAAGPYYVQEIVPAGWILTDIICDDDNSTGDLPNFEAEFQLEVGETVTCTFHNLLEMDYGDAPDSYQTLLASDGARHVIIVGHSLGPIVDAESDGQPSPLADGDDLNPAGGTDDEDGVTLPALLAPGDPAAAVSVDGGLLGGLLDAWIDFNGNGVFEHTAEHLWAGDSQVLAPVPNALTFAVPISAVPGPTYARFRLSNDGGLPPFGFAPDGEVEDYEVEIGVTLDYAAGAGGSLTGTTHQVVTYGGSGTAVAAVPSIGYQFVGWSDGVTDNPRTDTNVTANVNATANFSQITHALLMAVDPDEGGTTDPAEGLHTYPQGTVVDITAIPNTGYEFDHWTGDVADPDSETTTVTMDAHKSVTAYFTVITRTLTMAVDPGGGGTTDPAVGPHTYDHGALVEITATPEAGYVFDYWQGDVADPDSATTTVTMDADKTVTATFILVPGVLGDVNGDDTVDSTDGLIVLSCDVGFDTSGYCPMNCGDVNADGLVDSTDALIILTYDAELPVPYPVGEPGCPASVTPCPGCTS